MRFILASAILLIVSVVVRAEGPLYKAVRTGDANAVRQSLDSGVNPSAKEPSTQETPLHLAARLGHMEVVRLLLDAGADHTAGDTINRAPLQIAAMSGSSDVVRLLLERGAKVDAQDDGGDTALKWAAHAGDVESVRLLLARGAQVDRKDKFGHRAIDSGAAQGHLEVVKLLVENGADAKATRRGLSILYGAAMGRRRVELVKYLTERGAPVVVAGESALAPLEEAVHQGDFETVEFLLDHPFDVKKAPSNESKRNLLHIAVRSPKIGTQEERLKLVQRLMRAGVNPLGRDYKGLTPIDYAAADRNGALVGAMTAGPATTRSAD